MLRGLLEGARTRSEQESSAVLGQRKGRGRSREQSPLHGLKFRLSAQNPAPTAQRSLVETLSGQEAVDQSKTQEIRAL